MKKWRLSVIILAMILFMSACQKEDNEIDTSNGGTNQTEIADVREPLSEEISEPESESKESNESNMIEAITEAEADGEKFQEELWLEVLEQATVQIELSISMDGEQGNSYNRAFCIPWTLRENLDKQEITVFNWSRDQYSTPSMYVGKFMLDGSHCIWRDGAELAENSSNVHFEEITETNNLIIKTFNQVSLIGDPVDLDTDESAEYNVAAQWLIKAAFRYAAEKYIEGTGIAEENFKVWIYLVESNYNLASPEGELLVQWGNKEASPVRIQVAYHDFGLDGKENYTLTVLESDKKFYEVKNAICFESLVTTTVREMWKYSVAQAVLMDTECTISQLEYGQFLEQETRSSGEICFPAKDYDGDGRIDRFFALEQESGIKSIYWILSSGQIIWMCDKSGGSFGSSISDIDVDGDGKSEYCFSSTLLGADYESTQVQLWKVTEIGLQEMPIHDAYGYVTSGLDGISISVILEQIDETHLKTTHPDSGYYVVMEYIQNEQDGLFVQELMGLKEYTLNSNYMEVTMNEDTGTAKLCLSGQIGTRFSGVWVEWEMTYQNGVWVMTDFRAK